MNENTGFFPPPPSFPSFSLSSSGEGRSQPVPASGGQITRRLRRQPSGHSAPGFPRAAARHPRLSPSGPHLRGGLGGIFDVLLVRSRTQSLASLPAAARCLHSGRGTVRRWSGPPLTGRAPQRPAAPAGCGSAGPAVSARRVPTY